MKLLTDSTMLMFLPYVCAVVLISVFYLNLSRKTKDLPKFVNYLTASFLLLDGGFILEILGRIGPSKLYALTLFSVGILLINLAGVFFIFFLDLLLSPKISSTITIFSVIALLLKGLDLILNPLQIMQSSSQIWHRQAILTPLSLISLGILIFISIYQLIRIIHKTGRGKKTHALKIVIILATTLVLLTSIYILGLMNVIAREAIPEIQIFLLTAMYALILVTLPPFPQLLMLPITVHGIVLMTYGGVPVYREAFTQQGRRSLALVSSLMASVVGLTRGIEELTTQKMFRTYELVEVIITVYYGKFAIGCIFSNGVNAALRDLLKRIIDEFEENVGVLDEGLVFDSDISAAKDVVDKYREFFE
ncbi:MAG: hypothetical protein ACTSUJ_03970 [Candidatus Njordarchaeales archaeon]